MSGCVLDADVVIAALDRRDSHHAAAAAGIRAMIESGTPLLLSLVNYAETARRRVRLTRERAGYSSGCRGS